MTDFIAANETQHNFDLNERKKPAKKKIKYLMISAFDQKLTVDFITNL